MIIWNFTSIHVSAIKVDVKNYIVYVLVTMAIVIHFVNVLIA